MNALLVLAAVLLVLALLATGLRRVPAQRVATVRRFGRYRRTVGPGWHWLMPLERTGKQVDLLNHHLHVQRGEGEAELYYQILEPEKAGEALENVDAFVAEKAREADHARTTSEFKLELNRRVAPKGLRVVRCALHLH
jgi:regulator of protease activity HflC (stomatin/prohibitin superfamily)